MKILIVDDSTVQRMILTRILSGAGHSVIAASNGHSAVAMLPEAPDVIVCDILMPGLDGYGLLGVLAARSLSVPVVIATADIHPSTQEKCRALGAASFVAKPYSDGDMLSALEEAVKPKGRGEGTCSTA